MTDHFPQFRHLDPVVIFNVLSILGLFAVHGSLKSKRVHHSEFVPDNNSCRVIFQLFLREDTVSIVEEWLVGTDDFGQKTSLGPTEQTFVWRFVAAVNESIEHLVVTVQITKDGDGLVRFVSCHQLLFEEVYLRMHDGRRLRPAAVQVQSSKGAPGISQHDAIGIYHWH